MGNRTYRKESAHPARHNVGAASKCAFCGRKSYPTRQLARKAARVFAAGKPMSTLRCNRGGAMWHFTPKAAH